LYQQQHSFVWKYGSSLLDLLETTVEIKLNQEEDPLFRILDVGCGSGELTREIYTRYSSKLKEEDGKRLLEVLGMDYDGNMIQRAQQENTADGNVVFFQSDVCQLAPSLVVPSPQGGGSDTTLGKFDVIISNACLHWVHDASAAAAAMASVLNPNGKFVVEFGGRGNVQAIVEATERVIQNHQQPPGDSEPFQPWYFPSIAEYAAILEQHGIEVTNAVLYDRPTPLEDGENGMKNWLIMFGGPLLDSFMERSGSTLNREKVVEEIVDLVSPKLFDEKKGSWTADYRRIRIIGQKKA
jgi:SAM-dependent methyltransferase